MTPTMLTTKKRIVVGLLLLCVLPALFIVFSAILPRLILGDDADIALLGDTAVAAVIVSMCSAAISAVVGATTLVFGWRNDRRLTREQS